MRLIFITGLGEDETIFQNLKDRLPGEKLFLSLWNLVPQVSKKHINATEIAKQIIAEYGVRKEDVVIGHSTGGWVALHIKNIIDCTIVQIASWYDGSKVIKPVSNPDVIYFAVKSGLYFNPLVLRWRNTYFTNNPSKEIFNVVFRRLMKGPKGAIINQLRLIFNPAPVPLRVKPDLSIHARNDQIIRYPDDPFAEVPGDHFSLHTYPVEVATPILALLEQLQSNGS
jgi:hypothetical protein